MAKQTDGWKCWISGPTTTWLYDYPHLWLQWHLDETSERCQDCQEDWNNIKQPSQNHKIHKSDNLNPYFSGGGTSQNYPAKKTRAWGSACVGATGCACSHHLHLWLEWFLWVTFETYISNWGWQRKKDIGISDFYISCCIHVHVILICVLFYLVFNQKDI